MSAATEKSIAIEASFLGRVAETKLGCKIAGDMAAFGVSEEPVDDEAATFDAVRLVFKGDADGLQALLDKKPNAAKGHDDTFNDATCVRRRRRRDSTPARRKKRGKPTRTRGTSSGARRCTRSTRTVRAC